MMRVCVTQDDQEESVDDGLAGDDSVDLSDEIAKLRLRKQELLRVQNDQVGLPTG